MSNKNQRQIKLAASMLCANLGLLESQLREIDRAGVDLLHIDIMDGHFVPNMTGGADVANYIRSATDTVCDFHFMTMNPVAQIEKLCLSAGDRVSFHVENSGDHSAALNQLSFRPVPGGCWHERLSWHEVISQNKSRTA